MSQKVGEVTSISRQQAQQRQILNFIKVKVEEKINTKTETKRPEQKKKRINQFPELALGWSLSVLILSLPTAAFLYLLIYLFGIFAEKRLSSATAGILHI